MNELEQKTQKSMVLTMAAT
jgi:hypothetical protein